MSYPETLVQPYFWLVGASPPLLATKQVGRCALPVAGFFGLLSSH